MGDSVAQERRDWRDRFAPFETSLLRGRHPLTVGMSDSDYRIWTHLVGLCRDLSRDILPCVYCNDPAALPREIGKDTRTLRGSVVRLTERNALLTVRLLEPCCNDAHIAIAGLRDAWPWMEWKCPSPLDSSKVVVISKIEVRAKVEESTSAATPPPASAFASQFPEVFEILQSIDAKGYRTLKPTEGFERDLVERVHCLGRDRVIAEAKALRTWLDGKIQTGQRRRDARFNPQSQFINWLKKAEQFDKDKPNGDSGRTFEGRSEGTADRIIREARERAATSG